jgi:hypothetical protein
MSLQVWLCGSIRSFVLHVLLCGEVCRHVGVILNVLVFDISINVLLQTSALVGPLYIG